MSNPLLVRIDRAIADNLKDIERSFGAQAGIVQDFIVFMSRKLKTDLFGYTRFTLKEFCQATGRKRQELAVVCPDFLTGKRKPPEIQGYALSTVIDYALYSMLEKNIIFSSKYEIKGNGDVIRMHNFPILKDLKLNFNRKPKEEKVYDVRLSDELLTGFLYRYYTVDADSYKLVGKGRGGNSRKKLLIYLCKIHHVLVSMNESRRTIIPVDRLCYFSDIEDRKPSHKKQNLTRILNAIKREGNYSFDFNFRNQNAKEGYFVNIEFPDSTFKSDLNREHIFYCRLLESLKAAYDQKPYDDVLDEKDHFQYWLSQPLLDTKIKANILSRTYYLSFNKNLPVTLVPDLILSGNFLEGMRDVG